MTAAGASRRGALLVLALGLLAATGPFSLDAYLPALPAIALELGTSTQVIQLSLTACLVGLAAGQLVVGPIGDRFGRRTPVLVGALVYAAASIGCALAPAAGGAHLGRDRAGARPGSASALLGAAQFLIGGLASPLSGAGEPVSLMSAIMLVAGAGSLSIVLVRANRDRRRRRT
jgi:DHA1 family bicyclomycin/chloramphenicol resistance-like MFS transporter